MLNLPFGMSITSVLIVVTFIVALLALLLDQLRIRKRKRDIVSCELIEEGRIIGKEAPGPRSIPILGGLYVFIGHTTPYMAFAGLTKKYNSQVVKLQLAGTPGAIISGIDNIKEVLYTKGMHFDSRPNFNRYHQLFDGNKENSLAFCNWSDLQKGRREMLRSHTFPHALTHKYNQLNVIIASEVENLLAHLDNTTDSMKVAVKPIILKTCANIFSNYFCSARWNFDNVEFTKMVHEFDGVFYEVNQGYASDFMPIFSFFQFTTMSRMYRSTKYIREFVEKNIIKDRQLNWTSKIHEQDYVDCLINHVNSNDKPQMDWNTALFALEDIIGGHSAIGNFFMKICGFLVQNRHVQEVAQRQIDEVEIDEITVGLDYRKQMPYVEAIILETIRMIASPIVPHVANRDSTIGGYKIKKDTFLFLNNYDLNMSEELWKFPNKFMPERFIRDGRIMKPDYFLPYGGGRRGCMGYKMVQFISFSMLATLLKHHTIVPIEGENYEIPIGCLALPQSTYNFKCERRQ